MCFADDFAQVAGCVGPRDAHAAVRNRNNDFDVAILPGNLYQNKGKQTAACTLCRQRCTSQPADLQQHA
eukprot:3290387-Heterocapsa_arctica.AAC.1